MLSNFPFIPVSREQQLLIMRQDVINRAHEVAQAIERRVQHALNLARSRTQIVPVEMLASYPPPGP